MKILLNILFITVLFFVPFEAGAQGLVICDGTSVNGGTECDFCSAVNMTNNIINWLIAMLAVVAVLVFVVAGFKLVTSGGNPEAMSYFKARLMYIVIGFILVLTSWLIVDAVLRGLTVQGGLEFWGRFDVDRCGSMNTPGGLTEAPDPDVEAIDITAPANNPGVSGGTAPITITIPGGGSGTSVDTSGAIDETSMVSLSAWGVNVANWYGITGPDRTDLVYVDAASAALRAQQEGVRRYGVTPFQVTAAYTRGVGHSSNSNHYRGIAIDFDPINGVTNAQVADLVRWAGFSYVLDEGSHVHGDMR